MFVPAFVSLSFVHSNALLLAATQQFLQNLKRFTTFLSIVYLLVYRP